jgi:hypothetical protein
MEVLNPAGTSFPQWDAALSAGKPIFIVGNDDIHNVIKKERLGRMCTFVNADSQSNFKVLNALKKGVSYGVEIGQTQHPDSIPTLQQLTIINNTISLQMSDEASKITFIGQNGRNLLSISNTNKAQYILQKGDHYARAVISYSNGTSIYLNPVFFSQSGMISQSMVAIDFPMTMYNRFIGFCLAGGWLFWVCLYVQKKKAIYITLPSIFKNPKKIRLWKRKKPAALS